ncbi:uncharacterized protein LOC133889557 [Phragmites australis]|uniref:uncharacterized protein LOC133889557 n=1 Tax=Phragmites australis TaxID=29695 RepID=UPI002D7A181A|nr:uncharacterized protein LOC133889557 [Phragmites australis]
MTTDETKKTKARLARKKRKEILQQKREAKRARIDNREIDEETNSQSTSANSSEVDSEIWNFGKPTYRCNYCNALLWYEERLKPKRSTTKPAFGICCKQGKINLPPHKKPPPYLENLLTGEGTVSKNFRENIRNYNSMFSFTSTGGVVDKEINKGYGPYVFRMHGQNYHHIGTLLPEEGTKPRWAQLYIYDTDNEVENRISASRSGEGKTPIDPNIVASLQNMLDENNILAQSFRMARDRFKNLDYHDYTLKLIAQPNRNGTHGLPSASEVATLVVKDPTNEIEGRDIIIEFKDMRPQRISETHPKLMSLQYPLLYPYGEDGFKLEIPYKQKEGVTYKRNYVTMHEYYAYYLHHRHQQSIALLMSGHLSLQFWVDVFTCIEQKRLNWIRQNQGKLRTELYSGLQDAIERGDNQTEQVGKRIVLPSTFTGCIRNKLQNFQDAMVICRWAGYPNLFITFTCNAKWPEIQYMLDETGSKQKPADRPEIIDRVFMIKLRELLRDIVEGKHFGETTSVLYTIEFQKRGLPHAHILVFLKDKSKFYDPTHIDDIICAEIPDKNEDPKAYAAVENFMMHGPCGEANPNSSCMIDNRCNKHFPKRYNSDTTIDEDGFPKYKRQDNGREIKKGNTTLDNRFVVPYNRNLLVKFQAHINVEWCNRSRSIKYLFKYIHKGDDYVVGLIKDKDKSNNEIDEIKKYLQMRYISTTEACWRLFQFELSYRDPPVERLNFHLENEQHVIFPDSIDIDKILRREAVKKTKFTEWMEANKEYEEARRLTYADFPTKWVWIAKDNKWKKRKKGYAIGRIYYAHPASGERYYLMMLLNTVKGCKHMRT